MRPLDILTWHVHGSYLYYLAQGPHRFYLPVKTGRPEGYGGRLGNAHWPATLREVPVEQLRHHRFDCILLQSRKNYEVDQHEVLTPSQQRLPKIYLEHDPPRESPTETRHVVDDPNVLLVHVTAFNELMWDNGRTPTRVIDHGVIVPDGVRYTGDLPRGIAVVNGIQFRGRRLGADVLDRVRAAVAVDLVGMYSHEWRGLGEIPHRDLPAFEARYRFYFHPIRYTSLGLAVCEAMMIGMPVIGLATTELALTIENGVTGYVDTRIDRLIARMNQLLRAPDEARELGEAARRYARERFGIERFIRDWNEAFALVTGRSSADRPVRFQTAGDLA